MDTASKHYDKEYFSWQSSYGEFGGWANLPKFEAYVQPTFNVLDFGCGGGYLLKNLNCQGKMGIEISQEARHQAQQSGLNVVATASEIEDGWADLIISNHALEHTLHPLQELQTLYPKLKAGGRIVFVVPCEGISRRYLPHDVNHHLYSWSPLCLGNLFTEAGFFVEESKPYIHKWPPGHRLIAKFAGRRGFDIICQIYAQLARSWFQVRVIAGKG